MMLDKLYNCIWANIEQIIWPSGHSGFEKERERESVNVCVCVIDREREREREGVTDVRS